jgi:beta-phosphoglucomutase-like phosphatase (HAD superfamily)
LPDGIAACLFDLDGVLTRTAEVHATALPEHGADVAVQRLDELAESA